MALKITKRDNRYLARLVTGERKPCAFCLREVDDEVTYGKLYAIGDIQCHYFCCLLSCCLIQKGHDEEGLFGFRYADILSEVERCKKHKCSYCGRNGANLGCSVGVCRKQFHLPCGREKNAISLYYGTYKSFCQRHAPRQKIPDHIMANARLRKRIDRVTIQNITEPSRAITNSTNVDLIAESEAESSEEMVCVICYETVDGFPTINTFWPPCCARDAWFHRSCLQRMALSAGMHYLKCPLCNDKENFHEAVVSQGYYIPDRDAAWELEQNAFAEIYERPVSCCADACTCPNGREHDAENGQWDIKLCLLCGSAGIHAQCFADESKPLAKEDVSLQQIEKGIDGGALSLDESGIDMKLLGDQSQPSAEQAQSLSQSQSSTPEALSLNQSQQSTVDQALDPSQLSTDQAQTLDELQPSADRNASPTNQSQAFPLRYVCRSCKPAAPEDLNALASSIEAIIQQEQAATTTNTLRPVMPSRMSLRRTKGRPNNCDKPSSSRYNFNRREIESASPNVRSSRQELNLKSPRKPSHNETTIFMDSDNKIMCSPVKLLEQSFKEKVLCTGVRDAVLDESVIEKLRRKFRKPRPLSAKKRIVNNILDGVFDSLMKDTPKHKEQIKEWCSPKKTYDAMEVCEEPQTKNINNTTPTMYQDKENDSNTPNTLKEINTLKAIPTENDSNYDENEDIKKTPTLNMEGHCRRTRSSIFRTNVNNETENTESPKNIKDTLRNINCISSTNNAEDQESKIVEMSTNSISEDFGNTKDAFCKEETESDINETPTKNVQDTLRKTRSTLSKTFNDQLNSQSETSSIDTVMSENESTPIRNTVENCRKTRNSTSKIVSIDTDNSKTDITTPTDKIPFHFSTPEKQLPTPKISFLFTNNKNSAKTKNTANTTPVKKTTKDQTQKVSKYSKMIEDTKRHDAFLRNLINEENLCAKLLSELTRQQNDIEMNETPNILDSSNSIDENNAIETTNDLKESPNNITEAPNGFVESPNNVVESANQMIDTPKRKTIDIKQDSSLEISENDQSINIDVIKVEDSGSNLEAYKNFNVQLPDKSNTCAFKFSPVDKETLKNHNVGIDMESFKKEYLCEVDREFKCNLKPNVEELDRPIFPRAIDFASLKSRGKKRKTSESGVRLLFDNNVIKRRKTSESDLKLAYNSDVKEPESSHDIVDKSADEELKKKQETKSAKDKRKKKKYIRRRRAKKNKRKSSGDKNIEVTIDSSENRNGRNKKIRKKIKTKFAIRNENIHVKIKWKKKQLSLNIESKKQARTEKKQKIRENASNMKQYVLQFPEGSSKEVLVKPEKEVCKLKRKYVRQEKCLDKLKQMSIHSFFKVKSPENT